MQIGLHRPCSKEDGQEAYDFESNHERKTNRWKTIGGKGRLTEALIKKVQRYYGLAIRQNFIKAANPTEKEIGIYQMKKNIMTLLSHIITKQDLKQQYRYCPIGSTSLCAWQRDQAGGTSTYHALHCLPAAVFFIS